MTVNIGPILFILPSQNIFPWVFYIYRSLYEVDHKIDGTLQLLNILSTKNYYGFDKTIDE